MKNIGIDIVKNERFVNMIDDEKKISRILSPKEIEVYQTFSAQLRKIEYMASRFAAKEAVIKAINNTKRSFEYRNISILNDASGAPYVEFSDAVDFYVLISLSHTEDNSIAMAVLV